ncbi:MAG TPA: hypothetical protein VF097_10835 [Actinomycetota bacterium]
MKRLLGVLMRVWTLPNTLIGLLLGALSFQRPRLDEGVVVFDRGPRGFLWLFGKLSRYSAITFGHVVLSVRAVEGSLRRHERHHVAQYEVLGPLFLPTYLGLFAVKGYRGHPFEVEASEAAKRAGPPGAPA